MASLKQKYRSELVPQLKEELGLTNTMEVPRITKITLNMGVGEAVGDKKYLRTPWPTCKKLQAKSRS